MYLKNISQTINSSVEHGWTHVGAEGAIAPPPPFSLWKKYSTMYFKKPSFVIMIEKRDGQIRTNEIKNKYKNKKNKKTKNWQSKSKACESNVCSG